MINIVGSSTYNITRPNMVRYPRSFFESRQFEDW